MTQEEANTIDDEFPDAIPENYDYSEENAKKVLAAWNHLVQIMARENNMSDHGRGSL